MRAASRTRDQDRATSTGRAWPLVASREIRVRLTDRNFLITTGLTLVLLVGLFGVQGFLASRDSTQDYRVAVPAGTAGAPGLLEASQQALRADGGEQDTITAVRVVDRDAGRCLVLDEGADALLVRSEPRPGGAGAGADTQSSWSLASAGSTERALGEAVTTAVRDDALARNAARAGTTVPALAASSVLGVVELDEEGIDPVVLEVTGLGFGMVFYLASLLFGIGIAQSVVEEKQSRIVEILVAAIPVPQLLLGKVLGNTVLAVGQMLLLVGVGLLGLAFTPYDALLPLLTEPVLWYLPFFVAGFVALACVWAGVGALASRSEDLQSTTMPLTLLLVAIFVAATSLEGGAVQIGSFVPVMSTILMPLRLLQGDAAWWEPVLALGLTLAFSALTIRLGALLYRLALLQTQGWLGWRAALALRG